MKKVVVVALTPLAGLVAIGALEVGVLDQAHAGSCVSRSKSLVCPDPVARVDINIDNTEGAGDVWVRLGGTGGWTYVRNGTLRGGLAATAHEYTTVEIRTRTGLSFSQVLQVPYSGNRVATLMVFRTEAGGGSLAAMFTTAPA